MPSLALPRDVLAPTGNDDSSDGPAFLKVSITLCVLTVLVACHRLFFVYTRRGWLGTEEGMIIAAMVTLVILTAVGGEAIANGFGHHMVAVSGMGGNVEQALMFYWLFRIFYKLVICFKKLAFLFLYIRVFPTPKTRKCIWASIGVVVTGSLTFIIATIAECTPPRKIWTTVVVGQCVNIHALQWSWAAFDLITDLWIVFLPFPSIQRLRMPVARKVGSMVLFALGLLSVISIVGRMVALAHGIKSQANMDTTHASLLVMIWSQVEACVGLLCTCLPSLKAPVSRAFKVSLSAQRSITRSVIESRSSSRRSSVASIDRFPAGKESRPLGLFADKEEMGIKTAVTPQMEQQLPLPVYIPDQRESKDHLLTEKASFSQELRSGHSSILSGTSDGLDYEKHVTNLFTRL